MVYIQLTDYRNGKPFWLRSDQIAGWYFDRGHYHVIPIFDEVDIPVKDSGEEIYEKLSEILEIQRMDPPKRRPFKPRLRRSHLTQAPDEDGSVTQ